MCEVDDIYILDDSKVLFFLERQINSSDMEQVQRTKLKASLGKKFNIFRKQLKNQAKVPRTKRVRPSANPVQHYPT